MRKVRNNSKFHYQCQPYLHCLQILTFEPDFTQKNGYFLDYHLQAAGKSGLSICKRPVPPDDHLQPWKGQGTTLIQETHLKMNAWMTEGVVNQMQSCWSVASPASDIYSRLFYTLAYHICTSCILNVSICMSIYLSVWFRCIYNACRFTIDFATLT